jgi:hypothetical protein
VQTRIPIRVHRSAPMPQSASGAPCCLTCVKFAASRFIASIRFEAIDAALPPKNAPETEAEEAIWHIGASELLNHDSMRQMNLSQVADGRSRIACAAGEARGGRRGVLKARNCESWSPLRCPVLQQYVPSGSQMPRIENGAVLLRSTNRRSSVSGACSAAASRRSVAARPSR